MMEKIFITLSLLTLFALILNLPFGYLRATARKFSFKWFLYIHLPIPFVILTRMWLGFNYKAIPLLLAGSLIGQIIGASMNKGRLP